MKNNKVLIIICIVLLNILVVFIIGQNFMGKPSEYDNSLEEARSFAQQELCSKSIQKYNDAISSHDSLEVRIEMLDVYEKGIDIGEFANTYEIFASVTSMVDAYRENALAYEEACEMFMKYGKYDECANILMQARDLKVTSEKIEEYRNQVRYQYTKYYSMYTQVLPVFDGIYTVGTEDGYNFLNDGGSTAINGNFISASSFSEGYAFVKSTHPDGTDRAFLINKDGQRQVYFPEVESSSGVGRAQDKNGDTIYLLSCKVGDVYKYYDINGKEVFGNYAFAGRFRNNIAAVMDTEGNWSLIDGCGNTVTDTVFTNVALNEYDECAAKGFVFAAVDGKYNLYDHKMNRIGDFTCDDAKPFVDNYAAFKNGELWGYVDTEGNVIIEPQYEDARSFSCKMAGVKNAEGWTFINPQNEIVIPESFEDVDYLNSKGVCFVKKDGYWSYIKMYYTGE